jgi:hypothetical protein
MYFGGLSSITITVRAAPHVLHTWMHFPSSPSVISATVEVWGHFLREARIYFASSGLNHAYPADGQVFRAASTYTPLPFLAMMRIYA